MTDVIARYLNENNYLRRIFYCVMNRLRELQEKICLMWFLTISVKRKLVGIIDVSFILMVASQCLAAIKVFMDI